MGLAEKLRVAEYNPLRFSAVTFRLCHPKSTALIFGSGKIVVTGTKRRYEALLASYKYVNIIRRSLGLPVHVYTPVVQNIVASASFGAPVDLAKLKELTPAVSNFDPALFPGLIWRGDPDESMVVLVFYSGKMVITGAKMMQSVFVTYERVLPLLRKCTFDADEICDDARTITTNPMPDISNIMDQLVTQGVVATNGPEHAANSRI